MVERSCDRPEGDETGAGAFESVDSEELPLYAILWEGREVLMEVTRIEFGDPRGAKGSSDAVRGRHPGSVSEPPPWDRSST